MGNNKIIYLFAGIIIGVIITLVVTSLFSCSKDIMADKINTSNENEVHSEVVQLSDDELDELGIKLDVVGEQNLRLHTDLTGEVVPDPDKLAHIVPRFAGVVKTVYKEIGDKVKKDEVIAVIESNESLVMYEVKSSINGVILNLHMTPGELIGDDIHIVTVADLSSVWAELNVYQKDLNNIKLGQSAQIYFNNIENSVNGKIFYLSPTVDEHTRTATARIKLNNKSGIWKPGMFISAKVLTKLIKVDKAVSLNAIQNFEGSKVVFVLDADGFEPRQVTIGKMNSHFAEILSGINSGDTYAAEGAFVIKSELLKESFGGGHEH